MWTIDLAIHGGAVTINGRADTTTWFVIQLAYVNGVMWQENLNYYWWGKASLSDAWGPANGTPVNPRASYPFTSSSSSSFCCYIFFFVFFFFFFDTSHSLWLLHH